LPRHLGHVLAGVLAAGEEQRDARPVCELGDDAGREDPGAARLACRRLPVDLSAQGEYPHRGVVVVQQPALRHLSDELPVHGRQFLRCLVHDFPCVAAGSGMPRFPCSRSRRLNGSPLPHFSNATMLAAVASYFCSPTPGGALATNTSPHRLQRNASNSWMVAESGARPTTCTSSRGLPSPYTLPCLPVGQHGHVSPGFSDSCGTPIRSAPM
jgi:hypothetical protein